MPMPPCASNEDLLAPETRESYRSALAILRQAGLTFLVGGAYAFGCYTGITRDTKDFDVFALARDVQPILKALTEAGFQTELTDTVWLAKAFRGDDLVDIIFGSGNGIATVDEDWFRYATEGELLGAPIRLIPVEEMIWSKGYVMTRERYDGADVAHLLCVRADQLNWERLLRRYGAYWRVLFSHLVLFGFIYPGERARIPAWVMEELTHRLRQDVLAAPSEGQLCQGTLLSNTQYQVDIERWSYQDARRLS